MATVANEGDEDAIGAYALFRLESSDRASLGGDRSMRFDVPAGRRVRVEATSGLLAQSSGSPLTLVVEVYLAGDVDAADDTASTTVRCR